MRLPVEWTSDDELGGTSVSNDVARAFETYSGPVLRLREDASFEPLNAAAEGLAGRLNGESGVAVLPSVVQLAVKTRTENRASTRTITNST